MVRRAPVSKSKTESSAALLLAMANANRLAVLEMLVEGEVSVGVIADHVGLSQSALSQHLSKLRARGLVRTRRDAQSIFYSCDSEAVRKVLVTLDAIYDAPVREKMPTFG